MWSKSPFFWAAVDRIGRQSAQFAIGIVLARLLTPEDYGLMGIAAAFLAVSQIIAVGGLHAALVQAPNIDASDKQTAFISNLILGVLVTALIFMVAPTIANIFGNPDIAPVLSVAAVQIVVNALSTVHSAVLVRELKFLALARIGLSSTVAGGATAIVLASLGYGVWSLVWQALISSLVSAVLLRWANGHEAREAPTKESFRKLLPYSSWVLSSGILFVFSEHVISLVLARFYNISTVGLYNRANQLQQIPSQITNDVVSRVSFPIFSSMQSDKVALTRDFRALLRLIAFAHVAAMVWLSSSGSLIVPILFGDQWRGAIPIFEVLCFAGALYPINALQICLLNALSRVRLVFFLEIIKKLIQISLVVLAFQFGVQALAWSVVIYFMICSLLNLYFIRDILNYNSADFARDTAIYPLLFFIAAAAPKLILGVPPSVEGSAWLFPLTSGLLCVLTCLMIFVADKKLQDDLNVLRRFSQAGEREKDQ